MHDDDPAQSLFLIGSQLAEKAISSLKGFKSRGKEDDMVASTMLFFFAKAYKTYQAVELLCGKGFAEDAAVLCRSLFEVALQVRYVAQQPVERSRLFLQSDPVMRYRFYEKLKKANDAHLLQRIEKHPDFPALAIEAKRFKRYYSGHSHHWFGMSFAKLAGKLNMEHWYVSLYAMMSDIAHSSIMSTRHYVSQEPGRIGLCLRPVEKREVAYPAEATKYLVDVTGHMAGALRLDLDKDVSDAVAALNAIVCEADEG